MAHSNFRAADRGGSDGTTGFVSHEDGFHVKRLAPLEHIKNLYEGVAEEMKGSNQKIAHKKDLMEAVRNMNAEQSTRSRREQSSQPHKNPNLLPVSFRKGSGRLERSKSLSKLNAVQGNNQSKSAHQILQQALNEHVKKFNELKLALENRTRHLKNLTDELLEHKKENESLRRMEKHETVDTLRIEELKREYESSLQELDVKQRRKEQLIHMKRRLRLNQVAFDAHIKGMEEALQASSREFDEVRLLTRQLEVGNSKAQEKLKATSERIHKEREIRNRQLEARRQEAANAKRMERWRKQRERARAELEADLRNDLHPEEEEALVNSLSEVQGKKEELKALEQRTTQRVTTYEEAFAAIREATGVRSLDEMVDKFLGQSANKAALLEEKREAEERQQQIKDDMENAKLKFAELKAVGIGGCEMNREVYDRLDEELIEAKQKLKLELSVSSRLDKTLINVRSGMQGLMQKLAPFANLLGEDNEQEVDKTGIDTVDMLLVVESKLMRLEALLTSGGNMRNKLSEELSSKNTTLVVSDISSPLEDTFLEATHANNVRVASKAPKKRTTIAQEHVLDLNKVDEFPPSPKRSKSKKKSKKPLYGKSSKTVTEDEAESSSEEDGQVLDAQGIKKAAMHRYKKGLHRKRLYADSRRNGIARIQAKGTTA